MLAKIDWNPEIPELKSFGRWLSAGAFLAAIAHRAIDPKSLVLTGAALFLIVLAQAKPSFLKPLHRVWMVLAYLLGQTVGRALVTVFFFFVLTPFALIYRVMGRDALNLRPSSEASFWKPLPDEPEPSEKLHGYEAQF